MVDDCIVVSLDETKQAMRLMAEKTRVIAERAGALSVAAAFTGKPVKVRSSRSFPGAMWILRNSAKSSARKSFKGTEAGVH